jgi:S-adenosylmethionine:tRNA ribosyltransferase-isomerase
MRTADYFYDLPPDLIAQHPCERRDGSRLMVLHRTTAQLEHQYFTRLPSFLQTGDVLVLNNSRVIPARLRGVNRQTSGRFEILLLEEVALNDWWVMLKPGKRARPGTQINLLDRHAQPTAIIATVSDVNAEGHRRLVFTGVPDIRQVLDQIGEIPLPPYITRPHPHELAADQQRYQTVYAQTPGSVAAPTAGLHFTPEILDQIRQIGVTVCDVTLHVGLGTFAPVKAESLDTHVMHEERLEIGSATVQAINHAKIAGRRIIAAGTTSVRVLESVAALHQGALAPYSGKTRIFIYPPYDFKVVDGLLTNFHLPCSTLLMLVSAFASPGTTAGRSTILAAYAEAIRQRYRFFSYGDAMLIL